MAEPVYAQGHSVRPLSAISSRSNSSPVANFLAENDRIGCDFYHHMYYRSSHYIYLRIPQMFDALVSLYTHIFAMHWQRFRSFMDTFPLPENYQGNPQRYASAVYISSWFLDLYASNREACHKLSYTAYKIYHLDIFHRSEEYDAYLVKLNCAIRPVIIRLNGENTLFIPRFELEDMHSHDENYFNISGWVINDSCLFGLIHIFQERKLVKFEKLNFVFTRQATGRASWLFDWHDDDNAYAWFASEGNYDLDDVTIAYILGVDCTPKLGPCDCDEWQYYSGNVFPAEPNLAGYERVRAIANYGAVKKRIIESELWAIPNHLLDLLSLEPKAVAVMPKLKRPRMKDFEPQKEVDDEVDNTMVNPASPPAPTGIQAADDTIIAPRIARYRLVDYVYHAQVILNTDIHSRTAALWMMLRC